MKIDQKNHKLQYITSRISWCDWLIKGVIEELQEISAKMKELELEGSDLYDYVGDYIVNLDDAYHSFPEAQEVDNFLLPYYNEEKSAEDLQEGLE